MIRVLVAARSPLWRARATALLANGPGLELVGMIRTATDALARIAELAPDVLLLGTDFLHDGDELLRNIRLPGPGTYEFQLLVNDELLVTKAIR